MKLPFEPEVVLCDCSSTEHQIIIIKDIDEVIGREAYVQIHLSKLSFFKRLIYAIKYIFGYKCRYGCFEEFIISRDNVDKLEDLVTFIKQ
jgi:hypothetical protein